MNIDAIFKAYDVRGIYPAELDEEVAHRVGRAFVQLLDARGVLVARDMRSSSEPLSTAFISGALQQGSDVVDLGLCATDEMYFASGTMQLPGVVFTASHNPAGYNGIKLVRAGALPVGQDTGLTDIKKLVDRNDFERPPRLGKLTRRDVLDDYVEHLLRFVDVSSLKPLRVAIDAANGMAGLTVPAVFARLPFEVIPLYFELDGTFPNHPADPIDPENQKDLKAAVLDKGADVGLAFDGDADRVFLVDEHADDISGSLVTALVARAMLERNPGARIVHNVICSWTVPEVIRESGGEPVRTRVGHSFIKQVMAESGAVFGGEHSGHYYFRENWFADSGLIAAVIALSQLSDAGVPLSELMAPFRRYASSGEINSTVADQQGKIERLATRYADGRADRLDGLTVEFEDWWFNVRPSNTEPLLRLNVEARTSELLREKTDEVLGLIRDEGGAS